MVNSSELVLDATFAALADPTRRAILTRLAEGETSVGELAAPFEISLPAISKHLRVLERAGLLKQEKDGRLRRCKLEAQPLRDAQVWIERYRMFWEGQLDQLAAYLAKQAKALPTQEPQAERTPDGTAQAGPSDPDSAPNH